MQGRGIIQIAKGTNVLYVPHKWSKKYKWKAANNVQVIAGKRTVNAVIRMSKSRHFALSRDLYEELKLYPFPISWKTDNHRLYLGPFVSAYSMYTQKEDRPFADNTTLFQDMTVISRELYTPFYVITPGGFRTKTQTVIGWLYDAPDDLWTQTELPWPDFCMNKNISIPSQLREVIQQDERLIKQSGCRLLTRTIGSKWDVHMQLQTHSQIAPSLPAACLLRSVQDLQSMLQKHSTVYVKPVHGTRGRRIHRLTTIKGRIMVQFQSKQVTTTKYINLAKQQEWIDRKFILHGNYLAQQAVPLLHTPNGRIADFRWLIQKDGTGGWQITARIARVARAGSITTNMSTGADAVAAEFFLKQAGFQNDRITSCVADLDALALLIAEELETSNGSIGEFGVDFGVDEQGKPWIIEVNTRPGRKMLRIVNSEVRALSLRRPLEYARYTIGFRES